MNKTTSILFVLMFVLSTTSAYFASNYEEAHEDERIELATTEVVYVSSAANLPECSDRNQGRIYFQADEKKFLVCDDGDHREIPMSGPEGPQGIAGKDGYNLLIVPSESTNENCKTGGSSFQFGLDLDTDGILSPNEVQTTFDICNGALSLMDSQSYSSGLSECPSGSGVVLYHGIDIDSSGILEEAERDATKNTVICDGVDGEKGTNASLIEHEAIPSGDPNSECPQGGTRIFIAKDNGDGVLDQTEKNDPTTQTLTICNGNDGQNGNDGASGDSVMSSTQASIADCPNGGHNITYGTHLDTSTTPPTIVNEDGSDPTSMVVCNGVDGQKSMITHGQDVVNSPECNGGPGRVFYYGYDTSGDGALDVNDNRTPVVVCHGRNGSDGNNGNDGLRSLTKIEPIYDPTGTKQIGVTVHSGLDLDNSNTLQVNEYQYNQTIMHGSNGTAYITIANTFTNDPASGCHAGGLKIEMGEDSNTNGALDNSEIDQSLTQYICHGVNVLIDNRTASPAECPTGGVVYMSGNDTNTDGILEIGEVITEHVVCNGQHSIVVLHKITYNELSTSSNFETKLDTIFSTSTSNTPLLNSLNGDRSTCANENVGAMLHLTAKDSNNNGSIEFDELHSYQLVCDATDGKNSLSLHARLSPSNLNSSSNFTSSVSALFTGPLSGSASAINLLNYLDANDRPDCDQDGVGGLFHYSGTDTNGNDSLDFDEIDSMSLICLPKDGQDGQAGTNGLNSLSLNKIVDASAMASQNDLATALSSFFSDPVTVPGISNLSSDRLDCHNDSVGGLFHYSGVDDNNNNALEFTEIDNMHLLCLPKDGLDGQAGTNGLNSLSLNKIVSASAMASQVDLANELSSFFNDTMQVANISSLNSTRIDCKNDDVGGLFHYSGVDDNGNNTLEVSEIDSMSLLCLPKDGANGQDAIPHIVTIENVTAADALSIYNTDCPNGGKVIKSGLDDGLDQNGNLISAGAVENNNLEAGEVDRTEVICDNRHATLVLTKLVELDDFGSCLLARQLMYGTDVNMNRELEDFEVEFVSTFCILFYSFLSEDVNSYVDGNGNNLGSLDRRAYGNHIGHFTESDNSMFYFAKVHDASGLYTALFVVHPWSGYPQQLTDRNDFTTDPAGFSSDGQGGVYFRAHNVNDGTELWYSDGTSAGTSMLKDINTNSTGSLTHRSSVSNSVGSWEAATLNGTTYFSAFDGTSRELWMTDGTMSGTCKVTQMHDRNAYPYSGLDKNYSWMTDPARGANGPLHMFANEATNSLLFIHRDQNNNTAELWQYDPDASQGRADCTQSPSLATMGPALHKLADLGDYGRANYMPVSLGDGEVVLESICSGHDCLLSIDATVSYSAPPTTASTAPTPIYLGSSASTHLNGNDGANYHQSEHALTNRSANTDEELHVRLGPKDHAVMNGIYYFAASVSGANSVGRELYAYNPANSTAYLVKDIRNGSHDSIQWGKFEVVRDRLYFVADDGAHGKEMWVTDGTRSDTHMLIDLVPGTGSPDIYRITGDLSSVYFIADDGVHGYELWHTDGTNNGTVMLTNHNGTMDAFNYPQTAPATLDGYYGEIIAIGPMVYYSADDGVHGTELYYGYFFTTTTPW